jgi:hypothetical protein
LAVVDRHRNAQDLNVAVARCLPIMSAPTPPPQPVQPTPQPQLTYNLTAIMMAVGRGRADARMLLSNAHQQQPASGLFSQPPIGRGGIIPANRATRPNIVGRMAAAAAAQAAAAMQQTQPEPNEFEDISDTDTE